jgi:hypothetical protein
MMDLVLMALLSRTLSWIPQTMLPPKGMMLKKSVKFPFNSDRLRRSMMMLTRQLLLKKSILNKFKKKSGHWISKKLLLKRQFMQ